ncbi:immune inhibitor A domain-containing protein [Paenisporosarcina cavernae]|uniref:M6 family metalloprotease domain-containing protein n=1 Tax=Paenisporosarcina cavernae TaxID=2320858 RepID=A0A385YPY2_9BACL|nr:immune inhibitor A domain-containing protein [Paenisporosarcina cavernae]AYC28564.1 M6 family metalloprotease domain-containing protein [Paenisporosarcina cavernae]
MNKFWKSSIASAVFAGSLLAGTSGSLAAPTNDAPLHKQVSQTSHFAGGIDLSIVNDEKLIEALQKRGVIAKNATEKEKQAGLQKYIAKKGQATPSTTADPLADKAKKAEKKKEKKVKDFNKGLLKGKGNKNGQVKGNPAPVSEGKSPGVVSKGKLLTLTVEYADVKHNSILPTDTDNYYEDYNLEHFEDMIFGDNGVEGPNGENFVSQKQFYEEQSGGTYTIEGKAYGWLEVPGTAAYYGGDRSTGGHDNVNPGGSKQLIVDTYKAALAAGIPLEDYDLEDPHDLDGDGNFWEPDGLVDHLQIIHAGMGQEAGGGAQGDDAIWSHRSAKFVDLDGLGSGLPGFYDYTVMPEDGATGVFAHEYGHDLGYPDEYDTIYSGTGEAVGYWSIMASGSWAGTIPGTEPTGFSPLAKQYLQATLGGEWFEPTVMNFDDISKKGSQVLLDQANSPLGKNSQAVRVNLPQKKSPLVSPNTGSYHFWGGNGDEIDNRIISSVDLTGKSSATLTFDAWYSIEEDWDFAFAQVSTDGGATWTSLGNENTKSTAVPEAYPTIIDSMPGFTGESDGWQAQSFDLSAYAGQEILVSLRYATDWGSSQTGFFADNVKVVADGQTIVEDGAEVADGPFELNGFVRNDGYNYSDHYYLLEWRNHKGVDTGLAHIARGASIMSYDAGLLVWYVDPSFTDNWTGVHPGDGFIGLVDAHANNNLLWSFADGSEPVQASTRYHLADAAFGLDNTSGLDLVYPGAQSLSYASQKGIKLFDDANSFANTYMPDAGRNITNYGLKVMVNGQAKDKSVGSIVLYK